MRPYLPSVTGPPSQASVSLHPITEDAEGMRRQEYSYEYYSYYMYAYTVAAAVQQEEAVNSRGKIYVKYNVCSNVNKNLSKISLKIESLARRCSRLEEFYVFTHFCHMFECTLLSLLVMIRYSHPPSVSTVLEYLVR